MNNRACFCLLLTLALSLLASASWGAEATNKAAYSVCPDGTTTDLKIGSPTITIVQEETPTVARATLSVSQATADIGVGCRIDYDSTSKCWIRVVESPTTFLVSTATGGLPAACSGKTVNAIKHEYASLAAFEAGFTDSSHVNATNLVTADVRVWACCYDGDSYDDTTGVTFNWVGTQSADCNLVIYTPYESDDYVKESQRHKGVWTSNAYRMVISSGELIIDVEEEYTWIEGLQVEHASSSNDADIIGVFDTDCRVSNCIIRQTGGGSDSIGIFVYDADGTGFLVFNNILYSVLYEYLSKGIVAASDEEEPGSTKLLNNTIYHCSSTGIHSGGNYVVAINNLAMESTTDFYGTFHESSDYNCSEDDTAPGENSITEYWWENPFVSTTPGSEDLHLQSGADIIDAGTSSGPSTYFDYDVDDEDRDENWDIGADEYVAPPTGTDWWHRMWMEEDR